MKYLVDMPLYNCLFRTSSERLMVTTKNGNFVVTIESIIPNLGILREYKPLMQKFWSNGLFGPMDKRYFDLINRSGDLKEELELSSLNLEKVYSDFRRIFNNSSNVKKEAYFDKMTHFDFKCTLPALLHVEDRMVWRME